MRISEQWFCIHAVQADANPLESPRVIAKSRPEPASWSFELFDVIDRTAGEPLEPMDQVYATFRYTTVFVEDRTKGFAGLELYREAAGQFLDSNTRQKAADLIFWDAVGQFHFQTFGIAIPLAIVEELVAEARMAVPH